MNLDKTISEERLTKHALLLVTELSFQMHENFHQKVTSLGFDLTLTQFLILGILYQQDGINQTILAKQSCVSKASLGQILTKLEKEGWIHREDDPVDRRAKRVYLADQMRPLWPRLTAAIDSTNQQAIDGFSTEEAQDLFNALILAKRNFTHKPQHSTPTVENSPPSISKYSALTA